MDDLLWRTLLLETEGTRLDFKQEQYRFVQADDAKKSELLKDVLAFANAWRREPAYILIGVGSGPAGDRQLLGLDPSDHIDDATFQQFINSKLNRELTFSYRPFHASGKTFGIIEIPVQARPFFAKRDYGRVRKHVVYFRRGSSTAEATPEQIAQMGRDDAAAKHAKQPSLVVCIVDPQNREIIGKTLALRTSWHSEHRPQDLPDHEDNPPASIFGIHTPSLYHARREFWRELADYVRDWRRFASIRLAIRNESGVSAEDVRVVLEVECADIDVRETADMPDFPQANFSHLDPIAIPRGPFLHDERDGLPVVTRQSGKWEIVSEPGRIRPQETAWLPEPILLSANASRAVELQCTTYAANLEIPARTSLQLSLDVERLEALTICELEDINYQHILQSARRRGLVDGGDDE